MMAQQIERSVIGSGAQFISSDAGSLHYQIGETIVMTISTDDYLLNQGFMQPDSLLSSATILTASSEMLQGFPNPAGNEFNLSFSKSAPVQWTIFDLHGKPYLSGKQNNSANIKIDVSSLRAGMYAIVIMMLNEHAIQSLTFIKL
jgi:hypothetical protein